MPINDPSLLKFIAEGVRPAADRIIGSYDKALPLIVDWDDTLPVNQPAMWDRIKPVALLLWEFYASSRKLSLPWQWSVSAGIPDTDEDVSDGHNRPIKGKHCHRVLEVVQRLPAAFEQNNAALAKAVFTVASYTAQPADAVALGGVMAGLKALVTYLDDDGNASERRIRCRETSVNPNLFDGATR